MPISIGATRENPEGFGAFITLGDKPGFASDPNFTPKRVYSYLTKNHRQDVTEGGKLLSPRKLAKVLFSNKIQKGRDLHYILMKDPSYAEAGREVEKGAMKAMGHGLMQGATFGFGDEIFGAFGGDADSYREKLQSLRDDHGNNYVAGEILGSLPVGIGGVARLAATKIGQQVIRNTPPSLLMQSPSTVKNVLGGAVTGAGVGTGTGALHGFATGDKDYPRGEKAYDEAIAGGFLGMVMGPVALGVRALYEKTIDRYLRGKINSIDPKIIKSFSKQFRQAHKNNPDTLKDLYSNRLGNEAMMADVPTLQDVAAVSTRTGGATPMLKALNERNMGSVGRMSKAIKESSIVPPSDVKNNLVSGFVSNRSLSPHNTAKEIQKEISNLYESYPDILRNAPDLYLDDIVKDFEGRLAEMGPDTSRLLKPYVKALGETEDEYASFKELQLPRDDGIESITFEKLHNITRELFQRINELKSRGLASSARELEDLRDAIKSVLKDTNEPYREVSQQVAELKGRLDNITKGGKAVDPPLRELSDRGEITSIVKQLDPENRHAFHAGMRKFLEEKLQGTNKSGMNTLTNALNKKGSRNMVEDLMGVETPMLKQIDKERLYSDTRRRLSRSAGEGSETAASRELNLGDKRLIPQGIAHMGPRMASIDVVNRIMGSLSAGRRKEVAESLAKALMATGEERSRIMKQIGQYLSETPIYNRARDKTNVPNYDTYTN